MNDLLPSGAPASSEPGVRVALVTGAGKRLGREIALCLAGQGWDVAVHCRASRTEADATAADIRALGRRATVLCADLADEAATRTLVPEAVVALGRLDAVVNSASTFEYDNAASFSYAMLERHLRANTAPAIVLAQMLAEHVRARQGEGPGDGAVVNLLDQKLWNPNPDFISYTLSKAALESATTLLALALAPAVRVVGVAPGLTLSSEWLQGEQFQQAHTLSPLGRSSTPQNVAATVAFALSNRSMTGTTLLVDGGQHLQRFERDFSMM
ncbi:NAD(P)-dependent dehydrogenase (short-subunit alcohol dehydrogenase family) [Aquabacterium commune]|uniref:NAD(P)-dependent dehydrogenase (Short-subunit alcohol dehydrogenase family) n=1 Tax=Aquabacterium commune TaxID=70586 RepID=A0A4R6R4V5_9BURK|nr:SDR family oxidoreductase [Aquabacterium commune]TDP80802.1 NAD(P)-dependent dehydrogenase (short-subunit alcohol dehydrogenase family) [Aquabacterium commune]